MFQPGTLQSLLIQTVYSIRTPHPTIHRRREHDGVVRMLFICVCSP